MSVRQGRFQCGICRHKCLSDCLLCGSCKLWYHSKCQGLNKHDLDSWSDVSGDYICVTCRTVDGTEFDYLMGAHRLEKAAKQGVKALSTAVTREQLFLKRVPVETSMLDHTDLEQHLQDYVSNAILNHYLPRPQSALFTTGDGDCLFNAVSTLLVGNESRSVELKYRCCIEMVTNKAKILRHRLHPRLELISGDYDDDCVDCATHGPYSSVYRVMALSNLLNIPIQSCYPCLNGSKHIAFEILNTLFKPPFSDPTKESMCILWTNTNLPRKQHGKIRREWQPNQFVPLVNMRQTACATHRSILGTLQNSVSTNINSAVIPLNPLVKNATKRQTSDVPTKQQTVTNTRAVIPLNPLVKNATKRQTSDVPTKQQTVTNTRAVIPLKPLVKNATKRQTSDVPTKQQTVTNTRTVIPLKPLVKNDTKCVARSLPAIACENRFQSLSVDEDEVCAEIGSPPRVNPGSRTPPREISPIDTSIPPRVDADDSTDHSLENTSDVSSADHEFIQDSPIDLTVTSESKTTPRDGPPIDTSIPRQMDATDDRVSQAPQLSIIVEETLVNTPEHSPANISGVSTDEQEFIPGPLRKFMDLTTTLNVLKGSHTLVSEVPVGRKDGTFYVVDNSSNVEKRNTNGKSEFWDDCGAWKKGATPISLYIEKHGKLLSIVNRQGVYCTEKQVNRRREFIPLQPQPLKTEIVTIRRHYKILKLSPAGPNQFRKRITWIEKADTIMPDISTGVAIVEYIGTFPGRQFHGCVKNEKKNVTYIRTKPDVLNTMKEQLRHQNVKEVERSHIQSIMDDFDKHRDEKQLRNIKYTIHNEKKTALESTKNIADHVICVEEMTKTHKFVKSVKHVNSLPHPVVTLFTNQQITDIKRFCCKENGVVLGMDKTYNLGEFHVTPTVYKDLSVLRRSTLDHPICFGPTFIHQSSTTKTYSSFMHDIADNLTDNDIRQLTIGTDEELAFKQAIKRCFPGCTHVLCTRHLKQNTNKYLEDMVGYPMQDRNEILSEIYGDNGLLVSTDIDTHAERLDRIRAKIDEKDTHVGDKKFQPYFEGRLYPVLDTHIIVPVKNGKITHTWTNNNSESANHVLKSANQWKAKDMPSFIKGLYTIIHGEAQERCRAVRGMGNFVLADNFRNNLIEIDQWSRLSEDQREKRLKRFLSDTGKSNQNVVISTDGTRTTMRTPTAGKKPNQVKRKRSERSRTPAKTSKRRLI